MNKLFSHSPIGPLFSPYFCSVTHNHEICTDKKFIISGEIQISRENSSLPFHKLVISNNKFLLTTLQYYKLFLYIIGKNSPHSSVGWQTHEPPEWNLKLPSLFGGQKRLVKEADNPRSVSGLIGKGTYLQGLCWLVQDE